MTRPDPLKALISYISSHPDMALVSGRVFGVELPHSEGADMPRPCIVMRPTGGPGSNDYLRIGSIRFDVFSYGETPIEAMEVHRAVADVLKHMERHVEDDILLHHVNDAGGPSTTRDPITLWPYVLSVWMLTASEYEII